MKPNFLYIPHFLDNSSRLFSDIKSKTQWDTSMRARNTASYGAAYNYSQMAYPDRPIPTYLAPLLKRVTVELGFEPNNILFNHYQNGSQSMGFHSDDAMSLAPYAGVAIVSLGSPRTMRFRTAQNHDHLYDLILEPGSLLHLSDELQQQWQHAIPKQDDAGERISITLRRIITTTTHPHSNNHTP